MMVSDAPVEVSLGPAGPASDMMPSLYPAAMVDGNEASLEAAIERAAELLHEADLPLVYGMSNTTCEAQKECVAMADRLGGIVDSHTSL